MIQNITPIRAEWFYYIEGNKTKLNWFLFEFALGYYDAINSSPELEDYRSQYGKRQIAQYCSYFARRIKESLQPVDEPSVQEPVQQVTPAYEEDIPSGQRGSGKPGWYPDVDYFFPEAGNMPSADVPEIGPISGLGLEEMEMTPDDIIMQTSYYDDRDHCGDC